MAGVAMIARSTAPGTSAIFAKALTPRTLFRFRLIGYKVRPDESRFSIKVRPTLCGAAVAPIKAIACGLNIARRIGLRSTTVILMDFDLLPGGLLIFSIFLDPGTRADHGAFRDDDDPLANVIVWAVQLARLTIGCDYDPIPDPGVLVDNGTLNRATTSDT